ncbi:MAG: EAL domain-containing protein, partial [Lachnospiraceae bacterium]|nr:EAL domain-containing protein [Lachnospiraceae bacterium]
TIIKIGDFVINDVMRFIHDERPEDLGVDFIEVNLSILQCLQGDLAERINDAFEKYNIKAGQVNFEITETATEYAYDAVISTMKEISNMGSGFSLDDYGSGYSNLQRLMSFPYMIIKIDKSLVDQITVPKKRKMIENTVNFIKTTGAKVVVEGVETEEQAQIFIDMGVEYIQGYYYARPMPEEEYLAFLKKNNV